MSCTPTRELISRILDSGNGIHDEAYRMQWFPGDDLLALTRPRGLPIGNQTSQFWANVYLHELDEFVKRELHCRAYLRYCDDFLLFADDKPTLHRWRAALEEKLAGLRLKIHAHKTRIHPVSTGIPFLGFQVFPDHRRLSRDNALRFKHRWRCRRGLDQSHLSPSDEMLSANSFPLFLPPSLKGGRGGFQTLAPRPGRKSPLTPL